MSYILDALRKSEEERLRERSPDFLREPVVTPSQMSRAWPRLAIPLAVLALAAAVWFLWPASRPPADGPAPAPSRQGTPQGDTVMPPAPVAPSAVVEANRDAPRPALDGATKPAVPTSPGREGKEAAPKGGSATEPGPEHSLAPPGAELKRLPKDTELPLQSARVEEKSPRKTPAPELPPPPNRVLDITELPPALKESLPNLAMHGFVYTEDPRGRMVVINGRMLQEGDDVGGDIKLERIGPDGAVLKFRGYRFFAPR